MTIEEVRQQVKQLIDLRSLREPVWRELAEWILPFRGNFSTDSYTGRKRNKNIINNASSRALIRGSAGLTSGMTPTTLPWFRHDYVEAWQREAQGARQFADTLDEAVGRTLSAGGFYQAIHQFNQELLGFGCALLYTESDNKGGVDYVCVPCGSYAVAVNMKKIPIAVTRVVRLNVLTLAEIFGKEKLSSRLQEKLITNPYDEVEINHYVCVRKNRKEGMENTQMPYASYYFENNATNFLSVSGYVEMPFFFTAWADSNSVYGFGCGDNVIDDQKYIDGLEKRKIVGLDKTIDPPVKASANFKNKLNTMAGAINPVSAYSQEGIEPVYQIPSFASIYPHVMDDLRNVMLRIEDNLLASVFADAPYDIRPTQISATEWQGRKRERIQLMEPSLSSYEPRVLKPMIGRTLAILERAGELPVPPDSLGEVALIDIEFVSPLSQILRQVRGDSARAFIQEVAITAQLNPESMDKVNFDQYLDEMAYSHGVPGGITKSDDEVAQIRQERAKAQQAQMQEQMIAQALQSKA